MKITRETIQDKLIGLPNIVVKNVEVRRCPECGEQAIVYQRMEELVRTITRAVIEKSGRLTGAEIRFLRKSLGWSRLDFASHFGIAPETITRWESGQQAMGPIADRLLRVSVAKWKPIQDYSVEALDIVSESSRPLKLKIEMKRNEWRLSVA